MFLEIASCCHGRKNRARLQKRRLLYSLTPRSRFSRWVVAYNLAIFLDRLCRFHFVSDIGVTTGAAIWWHGSFRRVVGGFEFSVLVCVSYPRLSPWLILTGSESWQRVLVTGYHFRRCCLYVDVTAFVLREIRVSLSLSLSL